MTRVLVLTAIDLEARTLARQLGLVRVDDRPWPHYRGGVLEVASVGVRATAIESRVAACRPPSLVVSAGVCGALSPELREGDLLVPETIVAPDGRIVPTEPVPALRRKGALLTVTSVVATAEAKARMWIATGADAVDMESATIVEWARARSIPAAAVRGVSDTAARGVPEHLASLVDERGSVNAGRAMRVMLTRPRAVTDALALRRGSSAALTTIARALAMVARSLG